jgi:hypothetical protein
MAKDPKSSEPFVSQQDRPAVTADTPLSELRVRDLHQVLGGASQLKITDKSVILDKTHKDFEKLQIEKLHQKELIKDIDNKHIKDLIDQIIVKQVPEIPPDPTRIGDPIERLQNSIDQLTSEVAQLKAKVGN